MSAALARALLLLILAVGYFAFLDLEHKLREARREIADLKRELRTAELWIRQRDTTR